MKEKKMQKKYIFTLDKYYNDEEIAKVSPIIENFVNLFGDEDGVATLKLKDDVSVVVKKDEGLVLHMVLDNAEHFTALPKKLSRPKDFLAKFITAMATKVSEATAKTSVETAKAKVETDAENTLFDYIGGTPAKPEVKTTVTVNGEEVTDPEEKERVVEDVDAKIAAMREQANKIFNATFDTLIKRFIG